MDNNIFLLIIGILVFVVIIVLVLFVLINNSRNNAYINQSIFEMKSVLSNNLLKFSENMNTDFTNLSERLNSNLIQSHRTTNEVFNNINERMIRIDEAQKGINELSSEIVSLQKILTDKKLRGTFGEIELYSLLEEAYGNNNDKYQKQYKLPNDSICDAVIFGGESLGLICVDSKFPLDNYRRIYDDNLSLQEKEGAKKAFKNDVKKHILDIKNKYIIPGVTSDLAYMFIPAEAVFSEIYAHFYDLVELSYQSKVYLVSPTTLMAYITAIKSIYLGQTKDEKAKQIQQLLNELSIEFNRFNERNIALYKDFIKIQTDYEQLNTTTNKIIKKFNKIYLGEIDE